MVKNRQKAIRQNLQNGELHFPAATETFFLKLFLPPRRPKTAVVVIAVGHQGATGLEVQYKGACVAGISQTETASAATCRWPGCC